MHRQDYYIMMILYSFSHRNLFGILICSISLLVIVSVLVGVALGLMGFKKGVQPHERTKLSHCGGVVLIKYVSRKQSLYLQWVNPLLIYFDVVVWQYPLCWDFYSC